MTNIYLKEKKLTPLLPKKSTIDFLLNYSKSIKYLKTEQLNILVNLN
jgi:hypothetical protein